MRDENRTLMYAGCAGCVGAGGLLVVGGGLAVYGWSGGSTLFLALGIGLCVLSVVVGAVASIVNNFGFGRDIAERWDARR